MSAPFPEMAEMPRSLSVPRAVLFDWDNTLVDTWPCIHAAINRTMAAMDHPPWTLEETKARVARSLRDSFPALFGERWREAREIYYESFSAIHLEMLTALPDSHQMLSDLAGLGINLAVVSNKTGRFLRAEADHLGWTPFFKALVGATDAARDKPAPEPVQMALTKSGLDSPSDVWFVGDTPLDMECAVASGCLPVLLRSDPPEERAFETHRPKLYFQRGAEFVALVRSL